MTKDTIAAALSAESLTPTQDTFTIPEEREAIFLVAAPGDVMPVNKVIRAELRDKYLCLHTVKDEHFCFTYDLILGLRLLAAHLGKERLAGFAK